MDNHANYPHIFKEDGELARLCSHPRTRVAMIVMDYLAHGWSVDEMCRHYEYLKPAETHAAMAYYFDHQEEIDAEIRSEIAEANEARARAGPSPLAMRLRAQGLL
jgi:hypothetical protein